jgi:hypothetical protein
VALCFDPGEVRFPSFHRQKRRMAAEIAIPGEIVHEDIPEKAFCPQPACDTQVSSATNRNTGSRKHVVTAAHLCFVYRLRQKASAERQLRQFNEFPAIQRPGFSCGRLHIGHAGTNRARQSTPKTRGRTGNHYWRPAT